MPLIGNLDHEEQFQGGGNFGYSAARIDHLEEVGATEYTLATLVVDESASVTYFRDGIEGAIKSAVESWKKHPRAEYLLVRVIAFSDSVREIHGFRLLSDIDPSDYDGSIQPNGMTALYAASVNGINPAVDYARKLVDSDFLVNAITVAVTDGDDNRSRMQGISASDVKEAVESALQSECLESHVSILVGVNCHEARLKTALAKFEAEAGFDQYVELEDADADTLAKLGNFMARSVSSQSQSLGSGGPSQPLTF